MWNTVANVECGFASLERGGAKHSLVTRQRYGEHIDEGRRRNRDDEHAPVNVGVVYRRTKERTLTPKVDLWVNTTSSDLRWACLPKNEGDNTMRQMCFGMC